MRSTEQINTRYFGLEWFWNWGMIDLGEPIGKVNGAKGFYLRIANIHIGVTL